MRIVLSLLLILILAIGGYVIYMQACYYRIPDNETIEVVPGTSAEYKQPLQLDTNYRAASYNIGFGAYTSDYTFFMDTGVMANGTKTKGVQSRAASEESVNTCITGDINLMQQASPDFMLFQEVDINSTRSYHINQAEMIEKAFPWHEALFASNFHTPYLMYPFSISPLVLPHGSVDGGLLTLSDYQSNASVRRSYPVSDAIPEKFVDLDRCFALTRIPVEGNHELVLINNHMSAYDKGGEFRARQIQMLFDVLKEERAKGNYVIVGGDFNHALCGSETMYKSAQLQPEWVSVLKDSEIPEGFRVVAPDNLQNVASCRGVDIPYEKDYTYTVTVDGFIASDNVEASAEIIDNGFKYSDHNPVLLNFALKKENS